MKVKAEMFADHSVKGSLSESVVNTSFSKWVRESATVGKSKGHSLVKRDKNEEEVLVFAILPVCAAMRDPSGWRRAV